MTNCPHCHFPISISNGWCLCAFDDRDTVHNLLIQIAGDLKRQIREIDAELLRVRAKLGPVEAQ